MIDKRIKFRHIQCFVEIAREGSFKRAAQNLSLTQPAISKTLKELEAFIGARLMQRDRSGITLTTEGEVFIHFARTSLASLQQSLDGVEQAGRAATEQLTVGSLPSVAAFVMPQITAEFTRHAPHALLRIMDGPHGYLVDRLRLGELDLVIGRLGRPGTMQGISFTQLYNEEVVLVVRPGHPLLKQADLARLADWPVLVPPEGSAIRPLVDRWLIAHGVGHLPHRLETVSGAFGHVYTRTSDAIWIISGGVVARDVSDGTLVRLPFNTDITQGPVGLMRRPDAVPKPVAQMFEMAVHAVIKANHPSPRPDGKTP